MLRKLRGGGIQDVLESWCQTSGLFNVCYNEQKNLHKSFCGQNISFSIITLAHENG